MITSKYMHTLYFNEKMSMLIKSCGSLHKDTGFSYKYTWLHLFSQFVHTQDLVALSSHKIIRMPILVENEKIGLTLISFHYSYNIPVYHLLNYIYSSGIPGNTNDVHHVQEIEYC